MCVTYETSFPMRGASTVARQPHQILRLPRNLEVEDLRWKCLQCFRQYKDDSNIFRTYPRISDDKIVISHPPLRRPSPCDLGDNFVLKNTTFRAPAISQNVTKCCAWPRKVTLHLHQILRLPRKVTLQLHQILCLPHKMNRISAPHHTWKRHFQCAQQAKPPSNLTKYCACHEIRSFMISAQNPWIASANRKTIRTYSEHIRGYPTIKLSSRTRRFGDLPRAILGDNFCNWKIQRFALRLSPKMSRSAAPATEKSHSTFTKYCACHEKSTGTVTVLNCDSTELWLYWTVTLLNCYSTELWLYWTVTLLNCDSTELWLYWTVTLLNCGLYWNCLLYWTVTLLKLFTLLNCDSTETVTLLNCDSTELWLYWTVTLLNCYSTELWLYWTVTLLNCDSTELLLYWTVTLLNCYSPELWLYWTVTLLNCYSTELWLYWNCYSPELWLYWTVTLLNCYSTELWLYWTVTLLNCDSTELWLYWTVTLLKFKAFLKLRNSELWHPNFLW